MSRFLLTGIAFALVCSAAVSHGQEARTIHIVTLGDSITKGVRTGVSAEQTFASLIETGLKDDGHSVKVTNVGIGGERTDQALKRLANVMSLEPAFVTIMYGTNDSYVDKGKTESRLSVDDYAGNLQQIIRTLREHHVTPILMTEPRWSDDAKVNGLGEHPNVRLSEYVEACREVAWRLDVPLVDNFAAWTRARSDKVNLRDWTTDGCHPNPPGHKKIARAMQPVLGQVLTAAARTAPLDEAVRLRCLKVLVEGAASGDFWPSIHALEGLTVGGRFKTAGPLVIARIASVKLDDQQRCGISREFVRAGQRAHASVMLHILAGEDDFGHVHAAESLYKVNEIGDGVAMRRAFRQTKNLRLRVMAAAALGRFGHPEAMSFVRGKVLNDEDPEVYKLGAWILGRIGEPSDIPRLKKHLSRCPDELTKAYFEHSLAALGDADGLKALAENLKSKDPAVRTYAATFAGDSRAVVVAPDLRTMLNDKHADARYRAAQSLLTLDKQPPPDRTEDISRLVWQATEKNPRYTEGSIVERHDGSLLFAVTEFQDSTSDFARAQLIGRISRDEGRTWGPKFVLMKNVGDMNLMSVTLRGIRAQPKLPLPLFPYYAKSPEDYPKDIRISDVRGRNIAMFYLQKNNFDDLDLYVRITKDGGASFLTPTLITADPGYHVVNNDRITRLSSGRLLAPAASTSDVKKVNHFVSHCYISDDDGKTWRNGKGHVDAPKRGAMEPEVVELSDGRILMIVRTQLGYIGKSYSSDGGDTWSKMESLGVRAPEAPSTLRRIPSTGDLLLIWNDTFKEGAGHGGKRTPLTAAISSDEGETWKTVGNLESDPNRTYAYTSLTFIRHRAVMSYWESEKDGKLSCRFRSVPMSWFYR